MVYVKRLLIVLIILILLTFNVGFCADTLVNFNGVSTNNFYLMLSRLNDINAVTSTYIPSMYTTLLNLNNYAQYLYNYNLNFTNAENYILNEQKNYQDVFIYICQNNETLRNFVRDNNSFNVYGLCYENSPSQLYLIFYSDSATGNTYQADPYSNVYKHYTSSVATVTGAPNKTEILAVYGSTISAQGRAWYDKQTQDFAVNYNYTGNITIPSCCLGYKSDNLRNYINSLRGINPTTDAIQENTKAIKESTDRILSNDTETISGTGVTDGATDTSVDLSGIFNTFSNAFTNHTTGVKPFTFRLPNGLGYTANISSNMLTGLLTSYDDGTLFRFYQAMYWIILGGYVLFDIKDIINNLKAGDLEKVTKNSSPIDNVVKASVK